VREYWRAMLNIHPALLPAFGGKGLYGARVHRAVLASGARWSGPSVHFVDAAYDTGPILAQAVVRVAPTDTPAALAARVLAQARRPRSLPCPGPTARAARRACTAALPAAAQAAPAAWRCRFAGRGLTVAVALRGRAGVAQPAWERRPLCEVGQRCRAAVAARAAGHAHGVRCRA